MNYYLKCEHCGHLNEIKTSYLVFCEQCGKKMAGNFSNWKMTHYGKTFEDYQKEVCITDQDIAKAEPAKPRPAKKLSGRQLAGILAGIALVVVIGFGTSLLVNKYFFPDLEKYMDTEWTEQTCGTLGLRLDAPIRLKKSNEMEEQFPDEARDMILSIESYQTSVMNRKLYIMANSIRYQPEIKLSLEGALQGAIEEMQNRPKVTDFQRDISPVRRGEVTGGLVSGKWKEGKDLIGYRMLIFIKGNVMWQVMVGYDYTDRYGREIADRIVKSVQITPDIALADPAAMKVLITGFAG